MRRLDLILVLVALALVAFVAHAVLTADPGITIPPTVATPEPGDAAVTSPNERVASSSLPAPARNIDRIRQHLQERERGTFVNEILTARDSNLARWPDRREKSITIWVDERSPLTGPDQRLASEVRRAFASWGVAGVPLTYNYIGDSARAEVRVTFVDHFDRQMSGLTLWTRDPNWWIIGGNIQLSLRSGSGRLLTPEQVYSVALHEVGHLLGLDHTSDSLAIMAPRVRVRELSPTDVATMRLIYELPPGSVRKP